MQQFIKSSFPQAWQTLKRFRQGVLNLRSSRSVFRRIYHDNSWGDDESKSGPGSNLTNTEVVRDLLPRFLREVAAESLLDIPCGDLYWMKLVDLGSIQYIGADIVPEIIDGNRARYADSGRRFEVLDIVNDKLPAADVLLCRDCFIHLPNNMVQTALSRICMGPFKYLITSTFVDVEENIDIELGGFRPINLLKAPFRLPPPLQSLPEGGHEGKSVAIWKCSDLTQHVNSP
ncbi:MAG TPA: class I SAM-dependent methyltransferase [Planctomycetes bacterium]|nr:class I SAM-dependent methyltransferase [Fuerstiella sp.]HIK92257.1 class I SAM-dependent methyltransferase [Planctomycetota bacterium]